MICLLVVAEQVLWRVGLKSYDQSWRLEIHQQFRLCQIIRIDVKLTPTTHSIELKYQTNTRLGDDHGKRVDGVPI